MTVWDLRFSLWWRFMLWSAKWLPKLQSKLLHPSWGYRQYVCPECWYLSAGLHGVITQCHSIGHMWLDVEPNCRPTCYSYKTVCCVKSCTSAFNCVGDSPKVAWLVPSASTPDGHIYFMISTTFTSYINFSNLPSTVLTFSGVLDEFGSIWGNRNPKCFLPNCSWYYQNEVCRAVQRETFSFVWYWTVWNA